jgi:AmiR/NasT family two-component response regulator
LSATLRTDLPPDTPAAAVNTVEALIQLRDALAARAEAMQLELERAIVVEQAKGILAARGRCSIERATAELELMTARADEAVYDVAAAVVEEKRPVATLR